MTNQQNDYRLFILITKLYNVTNVRKPIGLIFVERKKIFFSNNRVTFAYKRETVGLKVCKARIFTYFSRTEAKFVQNLHEVFLGKRNSV